MAQYSPNTTKIYGDTSTGYMVLNSIDTNITAGNTLLLRAYDTNLTGYITFATLLLDI